MELKEYLVGDVRDSVRYIENMSRGGLSKLPPLIITCAITGGLHGKEANPNLPEAPEEQVREAYDAYNAGASMVHIHRRNPENPMQMSWKWEEFAEINTMVRAKCPDLIINNTCLGGRMLNEETGTIGDRMLASIPAKPEVASLDIHCFCEDMPMKARKAPLFGRDEDAILKFHYSISPDTAKYVAQLMDEQGIKPEFEMFDIADVKYLNRLAKDGTAKTPYWVSMLFNGNGTIPTPDMMLAATRALPDNSLLNVIGIGAAQFPMLAMAMILGHHVRVGLEDNVFYAPRELAQGNGQMVERVVRLARELGRPIATPEQARKMMGLGAPRAY
ncbi:MAG: 3-keto-5-aminohexanoate cleavage protein [Clostridiales bacterium]|nr:3-keto-5-aminohexanoate cleavage protein [Clostridiales bacterium]